ncbi:unnamed protein product, partial [marine sediment metagenome]
IFRERLKNDYGDRFSPEKLIAVLNTQKRFNDIEKIYKDRVNNNPRDY